MYLNLKAEMARKGITQEELCKCIGRARANVSDKMHGKIDFKISEMKKIKDTFFPDLSLDYLFEIEKN